MGIAIAFAIDHHFDGVVPIEVVIEPFDLIFRDLRVHARDHLIGGQEGLTFQNVGMVDRRSHFEHLA